MQKVFDFIDKHYKKITIIVCAAFVAFVYFYMLVSFFGFLGLNSDIMSQNFGYFLSRRWRSLLLYLFKTLVFVFLFVQIFTKQPKKSFILHLLSALSLFVLLALSIFQSGNIFSASGEFASAIADFYYVTIWIFLPLITIAEAVLVARDVVYFKTQSQSQSDSDNKN